MGVMNLDDPVFRKIIIPWYDSDIVCMMMIAAMFAVFVFGIFGIVVAAEKSEYHSFFWVPATLVSASAIVIISIVIRMILRKQQKKH
jgi:hypothetical protein